MLSRKDCQAKPGLVKLISVCLQVLQSMPDLVAWHKAWIMEIAQLCFANRGGLQQYSFSDQVINACFGLEAVSVPFSLLYSNSVESNAFVQTVLNFAFVPAMRCKMR